MLKELHWLPVCQRIKYKVLVHTYKALHDQNPQYIKNLLNEYRPSRILRSSSSLSLVVPRSRTITFGHRSFSQAAPTLWNALPGSIQNAASLNIFKKHLKTLLFSSYYN